jgi:hypothetical protein
MKKVLVFSAILALTTPAFVQANHSCVAECNEDLSVCRRDVHQDCGKFDCRNDSQCNNFKQECKMRKKACNTDRAVCKLDCRGASEQACLVGCKFACEENCVD